jgi:hypothetical protein
MRLALKAQKTSGLIASVKTKTTNTWKAMNTTNDQTPLLISSKHMSTTVNQSVPERSPGSFDGNENEAREKDLFATNTVLPSAGQKPASRFFSWPDWRLDRPCYVPSPLNEF